MAISQELCKYSSRFHALSGREETIFETNDYFVDFECDFMSLALLIRLNILIVKHSMNNHKLSYSFATLDLSYYNINGLTCKIIAFSKQTNKSWHVHSLTVN